MVDRDFPLFSVEIISFGSATMKPTKSILNNSTHSQRDNSMVDKAILPIARLLNPKTYFGTTEIIPTSYLDGLRGWAALGVVIFHYAELWFPLDYGYNDESPTLIRLPLVRSIYGSGYTCVATFFIISGYVLTQSMLRKIKAEDDTALLRSLSSSIFRRPFRLYLPAIISSFIALIFFRMGVRPYGTTEETAPYYPHIYQQLQHWLVMTIDFVNPFETNFSDSFNMHNLKFGFLGHRYANTTWTLPTEFFGSLACWVQLLATAKIKTKNRRTILALIAIWGICRGRFILYCFNVGILLAEWDLDHTTHTSRLWWPVLILGLWFGGMPSRGKPQSIPALGFNWIYSISAFLETHTLVNPNWTIWSLSATCIVIASSRISSLKRLLENGVSQYLGRMSFAVYLTHIILNDVLGFPLRRYLSTAPAETAIHELYLHDSSVASGIIWFSVMLPILYLISGAFEAYIDRPCKDLPRKLHKLL